MSEWSKMMSRVGRRPATSHPHLAKVLLYDHPVPIPTRSKALPFCEPPPLSLLCSERPTDPSITPPIPKPSKKMFRRPSTKLRSPLPFGGGHGSFAGVASSCGSGGDAGCCCCCPGCATCASCRDLPDSTLTLCTSSSCSSSFPPPPTESSNAGSLSCAFSCSSPISTHVDVLTCCRCCCCCSWVDFLAISNTGSGVVGSLLLLGSLSWACVLYYSPYSSLPPLVLYVQVCVPWL